MSKEELFKEDVEVAKAFISSAPQDQSEKKKGRPTSNVDIGKVEKTKDDEYETRSKHLALLCKPSTFERMKNVAKEKETTVNTLFNLVIEKWLEVNNY